MIPIRSLFMSLTIALVLAVIGCSATSAPAPEPAAPPRSAIQIPTDDGDETAPAAMCPRVWVCSNGTRYASGAACAASCPGGSANCDIGCVFTGACICPL